MTVTVIMMMMQVIIMKIMMLVITYFKLQNTTELVLVRSQRN